jgi:hypothetical protein
MWWNLINNSWPAAFEKMSGALVFFCVFWRKMLLEMVWIYERFGRLFLDKQHNTTYTQVTNVG